MQEARQGSRSPRNSKHSAYAHTRQKGGVRKYSAKSQQNTRINDQMLCEQLNHRQNKMQAERWEHHITSQKVSKGKIALHRELALRDILTLQIPLVLLADCSPSALSTVGSDPAARRRSRCELCSSSEGCFMNSAKAMPARNRSDCTTWFSSFPRPLSSG